jgi:hypothetical protein
LSTTSEKFLQTLEAVAILTGALKGRGQIRLALNRFSNSVTIDMEFAPDVRSISFSVDGSCGRQFANSFRLQFGTSKIQLPPFNGEEE